MNETNVVEIAGALVEVTNNTAEVNAAGLDAIAETLANIAKVRYPSTEVILLYSFSIYHCMNHNLVIN